MRSLNFQIGLLLEKKTAQEHCTVWFLLSRSLIAIHRCRAFYCAHIKIDLSKGNRSSVVRKSSRVAPDPSGLCVTIIGHKYNSRKLSTVKGKDFEFQTKLLKRPFQGVREFAYNVSRSMMLQRKALCVLS